MHRRSSLLDRCSRGRRHGDGSARRPPAHRPEAADRHRRDRRHHRRSGRVHHRRRLQVRRGRGGRPHRRRAADEEVRGRPRRAGVLGRQPGHERRAVDEARRRRSTGCSAKSDVDGVAITHGTDTMEETAYFLNLVVKSDKPVVLTGSMRPSTSLSADGPLNIYNAVGVAVRSRGRRGAACWSSPTTTSTARAPSPSATPPTSRRSSRRRPGLIGVCLFDDREFHHARRRARTRRRHPFTVTAGQTLPRVDIIYAHAGMSPDLIDAAVANGAKGLVIAGVGDGNMTTPALEAVKRAIAKGVVVVRSSRVGEGIHPPQHRGRRRQDRNGRVEGAQSRRRRACC